MSTFDESERLVCSYLRAARSRVGCDCGPRNPCLPGLCPCSINEIPCQVCKFVVGVLFRNPSDFVNVFIMTNQYLHFYLVPNNVD